MVEKFPNDKSNGRFSVTAELHDAAWMAVHCIQSSASAKQLLAKDLMLLLHGIRASVLVDYVSPKSISKDLLSVIKRGKSTREEFQSLQLVQMCDGNFLLIHLRNLCSRLSQSIDSNLTDYLFIDCSASLARPIILTSDTSDSLLLPAFRAVLQLLLAGTAGGGDGVLHLCGEESGAPLPTLGGWLLEYPVVYFVAGAPGNCLSSVSLHLHRLALSGPFQGPPGAAHAEAHSGPEDERAREVLSFSVPASLAAAAAAFISAHLDRIRRRRTDAAGSGRAGWPAGPVEASAAVVCLPAVAL